MLSISTPLSRTPASQSPSDHRLPRPFISAGVGVLSAFISCCDGPQWSIVHDLLYTAYGFGSSRKASLTVAPNQSILARVDRAMH
jgi:hypothetical protein